ncbi:MAG: PDZ domain-containing protein [Betaproteobacteria bacterium]
MIERVRPNTPAAAAGLRAAAPQQRDLGDIIVAVNGRRIESVSQFSNELDRVGIDNTAELTVVRERQERKVRLRVIDVLSN